jgi:hypothetical protein
MERTDDVGARPQAGGALNTLARTDKNAAREIGEARQSRIYRNETAGDESQAATRAVGLRQRLAAEITKFDPARARGLAFWVGAALVAAFVALDVVALN